MTARNIPFERLWAVIDRPYKGAAGEALSIRSELGMRFQIRFIGHGISESDWRFDFDAERT